MDGRTHPLIEMLGASKNVLNDDVSVIVVVACMSWKFSVLPNDLPRRSVGPLVRHAFVKKSKMGKTG